MMPSGRVLNNWGHYRYSAPYCETHINPLLWSSEANIPITQSAMDAIVTKLRDGRGRNIYIYPVQQWRYWGNSKDIK